MNAVSLSLASVLFALFVLYTVLKFVNSLTIGF